jgi:hypothetical protein
MSIKNIGYTFLGSNGPGSLLASTFYGSSKDKGRSWLSPICKDNVIGNFNNTFTFKIIACVTAGQEQGQPQRIK